MKKYYRHFIIAISCLLGYCAWASAINRPMVYADERDYSGHWLWEPITTLEPGSVGASLGSRNEQGQKLAIKPGGTALLRLPRGYWLQLSEGSQARRPAAGNHHEVSRRTPAIWRSGGNDLFIPARLQQGRHSGEWLLPPQDGPYAYMMLENNSGENATWWLSRLTTTGVARKSLFFREITTSQTVETGWANLPHRGKHLQLSTLGVGDTYSVTLQGPGKWRLEAQTLAGDTRTWQRFVDLPLQLNNRYWRDWRLHPRVDHDELIETAQCRTIGSVPESFYIALPEGEHSISFTAPQAMTVRALAMTPDDFLFPHNRPGHNMTGIEEYPGSQAAALAQPGYDEKLFNALLGNHAIPGLATGHAVQGFHRQSPAQTAARLVEQRYRYWRELPLGNSGLTPREAELVDIVKADPLKGSQRYILKSGVQSPGTNTLFSLTPGQRISLHDPLDWPTTTLKLSLPVSPEPFDLELENQRGESIVWRWRPGLLGDPTMDVGNATDLAKLAAGENASGVATVSASFTVYNNEFPLKLSHNSDKPVWFSPFYRDTTRPALDQAGWRRARDKLGVDQTLALLASEQRPVASRRGGSPHEVEQQVWDDWQPLRKWLRGNRNIWTRGLAPRPLAQSPFPKGQVSGLIDRLGEDPDAEHLLTQLLKGMVVNDPGAGNREEALLWLGQEYSRKENRANLSAYHSWAFHYMPRQRLTDLADWLVTYDINDMAVRLYDLAGTAASHLPYQRALLRTGWQAQDADTALTSTWQAAWRQDWAHARRSSKGLDTGHPWRDFMARVPMDDNPVNWLQWAYQAPPVHLDNHQARVLLRIPTSQSAAVLQFYSDWRDLHLKRALATPGTAVRYWVIGPVDLQLSLNLLHDNSQDVLNDWIEISANGDIRHFPIIDSKVNPGIRQLPESETGFMGMQRGVTLSLGPGLHQLEIRPLSHDTLVDARILSPLLLSGLMQNIQAQTVATPTNTSTPQQVVKNLDIITLPGCEAAGALRSGDAMPGPTKKATALIPTGSQWQAENTLSPARTGMPRHGAEAGEVEQHLLQLLWEWPHIDEHDQRQKITSATALATAHRDQAFIDTLIGKLNQSYSWRLEEMITSSAGSRRISVSGSSDNPVIAEREKLQSTVSTTKGERLDGTSDAGLFTRFIEPTDVRITLNQAHLPYWQAPPARVRLTLNGEPVKTVALSTGDQQITVKVGAGHQQLRMTLLRANSDHWLYFRAEAHMSGRWQTLLQDNTRRYQVATARQPLELYFPGPRWLRIDQHTSSGVSSRHYLQAGAGQLQVPPPPGQASALYRVYSWQPVEPGTELKPYPFDYDHSGDDKGKPVPGPGDTALFPDATLAFQASPDPGPYGSARATDGFDLQFKSRLDFDTDGSGDDVHDEEFLETSWRHRRALDCQDCFWRSDVFSRSHTDDDIELLGTRQWLRGDWPHSSWRWELKNGLFVQTDPDTDWSWSGSASAIQTHDINEKLQHDHSVKLFGRILSADDPDYAIDNDVYTRYKDDHRHGLKLGSTLRGRPWQDSLWTANATVGTNEDFNPLQPDHLQGTVAWRQYWRPFALSVLYRHRYYLDDDDRDNSVNRSSLQLAANAMKTFSAGRILQFGARFEYDVDRQEYSFSLNATWNYTRGRGIRDFYPGDTSFYSLRNRDLNAELHQHRMINGQLNDRENNAGIAAKN